jgi:acetyl-CoA synthetase
VTKITYKGLYHEVCRFANALKAKGIKKGDRVLIYMPMSIQAVVAMQACARIAATHSVVFGGFSAKSVQERVIDAGAVAVITADGQFRGGKEIPLKPVVDEALGMGGCEAIKNVFVYKRSGSNVAMKAGRDTWWDDAVKGQADTCEPTFVNAEHPLFILYTSGSTGKPKGIQHSTAGYLLWCALTMKWVFDNKPSDVFWCTADVGWVTGHSYITYGPLAVGTTAVVFEGVPVYPDAGRFWKMIQDHKVNVFYTAPTAIRSLIKAGGDLPKKYNLSSLRILGTVGEPINPEAWMWYHEMVGGGRCPIVDTWWQTETGGHLITPLPGATPTKPGSATLPLPGIFADIVDETGHSVGKGKGGILVIKRPWPSMLRTIWGDPDRYVKTYWPDDFKQKLYLAGDGASTDEEGYFRIVGRIDDVLNVSGHRLGTMEIESALVANSKLVGRGRGGRPPGRAHRRGGLRVRGAQGPAAKRRRRSTHRQGAARLGGQGNRRHRQAEGHPLRRQPAEDALREDHAAAAARDRQGRGNHAGRLDAREPGDPRAAEAVDVTQQSAAKQQRLIALFVFGCLLFNYPVLSLFNVPAEVFGVPLLYAYIFAAWALLVGLMALVVEARR